MTSIRRYLLISLLCALLAGSLAITGFTYLNAKEEMDELFDAHLKQIALTLKRQQEAVDLLEKEHAIPHDLDTLNTKTKIKGEEEFLIQLWDDDGELDYSSHPAIHYPQLEKDGLVDAPFEGRQWRSYVIHNADGVIQVSQPLKARTSMVREMALKFIVPLLMQVPILGLLIWLAIGRSLLPLKTISEAIQKRSSTSLEPLTQDGIPTEVQPLVGELNELLQRLGHSLKIQRQFTADAAHELRTPLTAIQLQLEVLERAKTDAERRDAMQKLAAGIQRSIHLAQQLLLLARMEPEAVSRPHVSVDMAELARFCAEQFAAQAVAKSINLGFASEGDCTITGDLESLRVLVNNLIDNAIRYTPAGGSVDVAVQRDENTITLEVTDSGIGIPATERERVFDRFYRITGTNTLGTGLGLAIVKAIADQHQANITIHDGKDGYGTRIGVEFPA